MPNHDHDHKERAKDQHSNHSHYENGLSNDVKAFLHEVYELDGGEYSGIRLTSGLRQAGEGDDFSHHHVGDAVDIAARGESGELGQALYERLMNTQDGLALLDRYGLGIIDETDPVVMDKTGATGPHFHIGKDPYYSKITKDRIEQFASGKLTPVKSFARQNSDFDYSNPEESYDNLTTTGYATPDPFNVISGSPDRTFLQELNRIKEKEDEKEAKVSKSEARKNIEKQKAAMAKAEEERKASFIKALAEINRPPEAKKSKKQEAYQEEEFTPIVPDQRMDNLPSIFTLPEFQDGGTQGEEPTPKTSKQLRDEQYFDLLNQIRGKYQHLDPESQRWTTEEGVFDFGAGPIKGFTEHGSVPVTTSDYKSFRVGSTPEFTPDELIDTGITGLDRTKFEADFKAKHPELATDSDDYTTQFKAAWDEAYEADHVALAVRRHKKYGDLIVPVGTGKKSHKFAQDFGSDFGDFYVKGKQYLPYYTFRQQKPGATGEKKMRERQEAYYNWRQALQEGDAGQFESGAVEQQKYGGLFKYPHGGSHGGGEVAIVDKQGNIVNRFERKPFSINYQQTGPQSATWDLPGPYASEQRKNEEEFVRQTFNQLGEVPKQYTLEFEDVIVYGKPESKAKQEKLISQYQESFKKLYHYNQYKDIGLPKSNRIEDLEAWNKKAGSKIKDLDKKSKDLRSEVSKIQKKLGYDKPEDVLSPQGLADFRNMYKEGKISLGEFMYAYNQVLKPYDPNLVTMSPEDQKALYYGWHGIDPETNRKTWIMDPTNTAKVATGVALTAPLAPVLLPGGILGNPIAAGMALMDKPLVAGFSMNEMLAPYYAYKTGESVRDFVDDPSWANAGMVAFNASGVPLMFRGAKTSQLWKEYGKALKEVPGSQRMYAGLFSSPKGGGIFSKFRKRPTQTSLTTEFPKNDPAFTVDDFGSRVVKKGRTQYYDEALKEMSKVYENYPVLAKSGYPLYFHGSTSASLPGAVREQGLKPLGTLMQEGKTPLTGEIVFGGLGVNQKAISTTYLDDLEEAVRYSMQSGNKNPAEEFARYWGKERLDIANSMRPEQLKLLDDVVNARVSAWDNMSSMEKAIAQENFPVLYGIRPRKPAEGRTIIPRSDISGEIAFQGNLGFEEIPSIFVPGTKVQGVRELLGKGSNVSVQSLDDIIENMGGSYVNAGTRYKNMIDEYRRLFQNTGRLDDIPASWKGSREGYFEMMEPRRIYTGSD